MNEEETIENALDIGPAPWNGERKLEYALVTEEQVRKDFGEVVELEVDMNEITEEEKEEIDRVIFRIYNIFLPLVYVDRYIDHVNDDHETICQKLDEFVNSLMDRYHDHENDIDLPTNATMGLLALKRLHKLEDSFDYKAAFEYWVNNSPSILAWTELAIQDNN